MRQRRSISITASAETFLENYMAKLLREGHPMALVEQFAFELYDIVFERLPRGSLRNGVNYVGLDPFLPKYSQYMFTEGYVRGMYSACGDHVVLYSLSIEVPDSFDAQTSVTAA
jgi:hypothetical protein